ncbi:MAG: glycosyltransferase [Pyrinomonadaceae bacterium]
MNRLVKSDASTSPAVSICIVKGHARITETFILAQAERLPAQVTLVHDNPPKIGDQPVDTQSTFGRLTSKAWRILSRRADASQQVTAAYIKVLRQTRAAAVLAQYGPSGVAMLEACRSTRIPLIVHFHGFDASKHAVLEEHARTYPVMFREAAAIIAVSHSMRKN